MRTTLDLPSIEALLSVYPIGTLTRYWPASAGTENSNYFCVTIRDGTEREWVVTLLERPPYAGEGFAPLLDACVQAGLPVPPVLRNRDGAEFTEAADKPAMICPRLPGRHVCHPTLRQVEAVGRFLANFHRATGAANLILPAHPRDLAWVQRHAEACRGFVSFRAQVLMADTQARLASALSRDDMSLLPRGPIHGDLFRDNVLFDERGLTGVVDFHHAAEGFLLYDLAVAINDWCTDDLGALDQERALALLRAYHAVRPLCAVELWYLPIFLLYGAMAFWLSRLTSAMKQHAGEDVRGNNPQELQRIVEHHNAHFLYVNEGQLRPSRSG
jgi:homoserine kinase type II